MPTTLFGPLPQGQNRHFKTNALVAKNEAPIAYRLWLAFRRLKVYNLNKQVGVVGPRWAPRSSKPSVGVK